MMTETDRINTMLFIAGFETGLLWVIWCLIILT